MTWNHDALAADLAAHLKGPDRMVWVDMQLGPVHSPRPDVYTINKCYVRPCPTAYECKISVSDFRADVTAGKWSSYLEYAHTVVFAVPVGLITKADVPEMCGLIVRHEKAWRMAKKPTVNPRPIAQEAMLKLLIDGVKREGPVERAKRWHDEDSSREFSKRFGAVAARYVADAASIQREIDSAKCQRDQLIQDAEDEAARIRKRAMETAPLLWQQLTHVLGLEINATKWQVEAEIHRFQQDRQGGKEAVALREVLSALDRTVRNHQEFMDERRTA